MSTTAGSESPAIIVLGVPIESEALLEGVNLMPPALREAGLIEALAATDAGDLDVTITDSTRDPGTGIIAFEQICRASETIREGLLPLLGRPELPLVVGGCCAALIGIFAALRARHGRVGLAFVDGHYDFYDGATSPSGATADMELGILTGFGPSQLTDIAGPPPLVEARDLWVLGPRDGDETAAAGAPDPRVVLPEAHLADVIALRGRGPVRVAREAETALAADPGLFWLHLDLDVLDQEHLPAVDYLLPGGLDWRQLADLLLPLTRSPALLGVDVTIYNPSLDAERRYAPAIVQLLRDVLVPPVQEAP